MRMLSVFKLVSSHDTFVFCPQLAACYLVMLRQADLVAIVKTI